MKAAAPSNAPGPAVSRPFRIVILTPGTQGGVARMMLYLRDAREAPADWRLTLFSTHGAMAWSILSFPVRLVRFALLCAAGRVDLCHINLASRGSTFRKACYAALCRLFRTPYVVHLHGGGYREFFARRGPAGKAIIRSLFLGAGRVIVLGSLWRDFVHDEIGVPQARIATLANAVEGPEKIVEAERASPPSILFLGLLRQEKGIEVLLEALAKPALGACEWRAVLAGNGDVAKYAADVASLGLSERISLPGWCAQDTVRLLLRQSSILVLPSFVENLPLALLEAMAYGLCPVVTPAGAIPDIVQDGQNGLIVPAGDAAALAHALVRLLKEPSLRALLGKNARATFDSAYDIKGYARRLDEIYRAATA
jgi:glycosyltransferase involved in cell wall biosynthesis